MQSANGAPMTAPPPTMEQQQYNQQHQQWMMQQQQHYQYQQQQQQQPQQHYQYQQPPQQQPQQVYSQPPQPQQQQYSVPAQPTSADEVRTLWIGDLQPWMQDDHVTGYFSQTPIGEILSVKVIRNKQTQQSERYGFIEFATRAAAERALATYNGTFMPNTEQPFRLNWASYGGNEKRQDNSPDYTIFVGDLAADVTDYTLQETFKTHYTSVKGAKVVTDRDTGRSKGYGFVRFADVNEQIRAMTEMNGVPCSTRPMRIGAATTKKNSGGQEYPKASYPTAQVTGNENDINNTTIFVGNLDENVRDEVLRDTFAQYGDLLHVKIPQGKRCGFVQFASRACAEEALLMLNGSQLGGQNIRLSWGRSPANKQDGSTGALQPQADQSQWNGAAGYYGYNQGYEAYGAYPPAQQEQNMYAYAPYPGYGNYPPQYPQQQ